MADGDNNVLRFSELSLYDNKIKNYTDKKIDKLAEEIAGMSTYNEIYSEDSLNLGRVSESTKGEYSSTLGYNNIASGTYSHSEGYNTCATGYAAHTEGESTTASKYCSHAEGRGTYAGASNTHAEGYYTSAIGSSTHAEGSGTYAAGESSHVEGTGSKCIGWYSHAEGYGTTANGDYSGGAHAEGQYTYANGGPSHAEGKYTTAYGSNSHTEGYRTYADYASHAEGYNTCATNSYSHTEGYNTITSASAAHAEGNGTSAYGYASHAEGSSTYAAGYYSHTEGYSTTSEGSNSHVEGEYTYTYGADSHAEGNNTYASGYASHVEGSYSSAYGGSAHAEGSHTCAEGYCSHVEGYGTYSSGNSSHAEGYGTCAKGAYSHAEGIETTASGEKSHTEGENTLALGKCQHVEGSYNIADPKYLHILGNGNKPVYEYNKNNEYTISNEELSAVYKTHIFKDETEINWFNIHKKSYPEKDQHGAWDDKDANIVTYGTPTLKVITEQDPFITEDTEQIHYVNNQAYYTDHYYGENGYIYGNGDKYIEVSTTYDDNKTVIYRYGLWRLDGDVEYTENSNAHTIDWDGNAWFAGEITDGHGNTLSEIAGGGGGSYTLPTASTSTLGGVKIDNFTTKINNNGVLSTGSEVITVLTMPAPSADYLNKIVHCIGDYGFQNGNYYMCVENTDLNAAQQPYKWIWRGDLRVAPTASDTNIGMVRPDGTTIQITSGGVISASGGSSLNVLSYDETLDVLGLPPNPIYRYRETIPIMTSDTAPSGVASAGSINSAAYAAWKAFDGVWNSNNDRWVTAVNVYGTYLQYKFDNPKEIVKMRIQFGDCYSANNDSLVTIQGSNDGSVFTDLLEFTLLASENNKINDYVISESDSYLYYRIKFDSYNITTSAGKYNGIVNVQMYEKYLA